MNEQYAGPHEATHDDAPRTTRRMTRMDRKKLRRLERLAVPVLEFLNQRTRLKTGLHSTIGRLNGMWIAHTTGRIWCADGDEHLEDLDAPHGIIVAANHRSFFDLYVCSTYLFMNHRRLTERIFFPVRSGYFYTHPLGMALNLIVSGGSMWPPVFRDDRRALNRVGLEQLREVLQRGSLVGIHPEGRRGTGDDPYELLPAKPGLGLLMQACHPDTVVLPYFTLGLSNDLGEVIRRNFRPPGQRGTRVTLRFGAPMRVGDVCQGRTAVEATQHVMDAVVALGEQDREMRLREGDTV